MDAAKIKTSLLLKCVAALIIIEVMAGAVNSWAVFPRIYILGITRIAEISIFLILTKLDDQSLGVIGLKASKFVQGVKGGLLWSAGFALLAGILGTVIILAGRNPLVLIQSSLPKNPADLIPFMLVGIIIAPLAEEIFFRGIIYGYLKRLTVIVAVILSTALFSVFHWGQGVPVTQIVGGLVFAISYEKEQSLMAPVTIHILGNLAIFCLSAPFFQ